MRLTSDEALAGWGKRTDELEPDLVMRVTEVITVLPVFLSIFVLHGGALLPVAFLVLITLGRWTSFEVDDRTDKL